MRPAICSEKTNMRNATSDVSKRAQVNRSALESCHRLPPEWDSEKATRQMCNSWRRNCPCWSRRTRWTPAKTRRNNWCQNSVNRVEADESWPRWSRGRSTVSARRASTWRSCLRRRPPRSRSRRHTTTRSCERVALPVAADWNDVTVTRRNR